MGADSCSFEAEDNFVAAGKPVVVEDKRKPAGDRHRRVVEGDRRIQEVADNRDAK